MLVDEEDRRYFKQQEITLWRRAPKKKGEAGEEAKFTGASPSQP